MKHLLYLGFFALSTFAFSNTISSEIASETTATSTNTQVLKNTESTPTRIMIRTRAKDAKFIGSSIGGAKIIVRNAATHEILDQGFTTGGTGNTDVLMKTPVKRHTQISDDKTAGFEANLKLEKPTLISIEAIAPFNQKQSQVIASTQIWAVPGKDILGDGIILEIPGFLVDLTLPNPHSAFKANSDFEVQAAVMMMCGCPITKGGLWDAEKYEVAVWVYKDGEKLKEVPLSLADTSLYSGTLSLDAGLYELDVIVFDSETGNTGLDKTNVIVH